VILVDTSVWIEVFRKPSRVQLEAEIDLDEVVTCLPVLQEVLQGFRDEKAFRVAKKSMTAFPIVESPLQQAVFEEAVQLFRSARRKGLTVRSAADCLIAACALRNDLIVLHRDRDFPKIARIAPLQERDLSL
jgi:hypothetical protein